MSSTYDRILAACKLRGTTPGAVCDALGLRRALLSELKSGKIKVLGSDKVAMLAQYLRVSCDYLLTGSESHKSIADCTYDEEQLLIAWRSCTHSERENVAFILRDYGVVLPTNKTEKSAG